MLKVSKTGAAVYQSTNNIPESKEDNTDRYNTKLTPKMEKAYQKWIKTAKNGKDGSSDNYDYDMRGLYKDQQKFGSDGHASDKHKKPNSMTFSNQSKYNGVDGKKGGEWKHMEGKDYFVPSQHNIDNAGGENHLQQYFDTVEKGRSSLIIGKDKHKSLIGLPTKQKRK